VNGNPLVNKAFDFSLLIIDLYRYLLEEKHEYIMAKQLLRSSTSIGANINESLAAQSKKDFISKMSIALKEAYESRYWLKLLLYSKYVENVDKESALLHEIISMTAKSVITAKRKLKEEK
jgi:four helix bundle protein